MVEISQAELKAAIAAEKDRIKVDPYYTTAMNKGLKGHAMGFWSGTAMGLASGIAIGGALSLFAVPLAIPGAVAGLPLMLGLGGIGAVGGGTVGSRVGSSAGTVSGVMAEFERRQKAEKLEAQIMDSPDLQRQVVERFRVDPTPEKDDTIGENFSTAKTPFAALGKLIDLRTMVMTMALCGLAGAAMFAGGFMLFGAIQLGALTVGTAPAAALLGGAIGAGVGVTFGITYPMIFATGTKGVGNLLSQKVANSITGMQPAPELPPLEVNAPQQRIAIHRPSIQISDAVQLGRLVDQEHAIQH